MIHNCFYFYKPFVDTQLSQISQVVSWYTIALICKLFGGTKFCSYLQVVGLILPNLFIYQVSLYAVRCQFYAKPTAGNRK